jgi:hypothetical protein
MERNWKLHLVLPPYWDKCISLWVLHACDRSSNICGMCCRMDTGMKMKVTQDRESDKPQIYHHHHICFLQNQHGMATFLASNFNFFPFLMTLVNSHTRYINHLRFFLYNRFCMVFSVFWNHGYPEVVKFSSNVPLYLVVIKSEQNWCEIDEDDANHYLHLHSSSKFCVLVHGSVMAMTKWMPWELFHDFFF